MAHLGHHRCMIITQVKYLVLQLIRTVIIGEKYHLKGETFSWYKIFNLSYGAFLQHCPI